ncbi:hypothetical protein ABW19_dt0202609 [Dactylella cylindrospora]|nr:hypothetical protein ABW19_dt0202609 [Dactylella cylindrospora]
MAKDKDSAALKDSKKRKRDGSKSPSPLADPSSSKVTKSSKSDKKEKDKSEKKEKKDKKEKRDKSERKEKKEKKKEKEQDADTSMADVEVTAEEEIKMEVDTVGSTAVIPVSLVPFAKPLAEGKLAKKVLKTTKKAAKTKALKRGVKEVVKALRKSPNHATSSSKPDPKTLPLLILAGDISPPDVISHLPVLAEDHGIPYVFVTSRAELGAAGATKRPTSVVMITPDSAGKKKVGGKKGKKGEEGGEEGGKGLEKIKEEEEDFRSSYKDLVKEVMGVTRALAV